MKSICVYAGSNLGQHPEYAVQARRLGAYMAERNYQLVYGGSRTGLMGEAANAALAGGGDVVGVMPRGLFQVEMEHREITLFIEVDNMHERKATMAQLADGFIALPGGFGTYEELFEVLCWSQIGIHAKPIGILNVHGYFDPLLSMMETIINEEFARPSHFDLITISSDPIELIRKMESYVPVELGSKWLQLT